MSHSVRIPLDRREPHQVWGGLPSAPLRPETEQTLGVEMRDLLFISHVMGI
jgi:hypothetical protein